MVGVCDNCGNEYDKNFIVQMNGEEFLFDCFECAINKLAPICAHCDSKVIGHGVEVGHEIYCCNHCATHPHVKKNLTDIFSSPANNI